jgi:hypothetical protein
MPTDPARRKQAWRDLVLRDDFLDHNYLSDDQRHPLSDLGTNAARAMGTNALAGHTWGQMSSRTYKEEKTVVEPLQDHDSDGHPIDLYDPLTGKYDVKFSAPRAYYRTPTLVSIWTSAPYLHNNSVGAYTGDPSIAGRMASYDDGMTKLLWPELRAGVASIKVTTEDSKLPDLFPVLRALLPEFADLPGFDAALLPVPAGTPINLIMNLDPRSVKPVIQAYVDAVLNGAPRSRFAELQRTNRGEAIQALRRKLLEVSTCPDFIEDRGHAYGRELPDRDKRALIEYMKYF